VFVNAPRIGRLPLRILVPITDWDERYEKYVWMIMLDPDAANGLTKTSAADAFQVRSASLERFLERVGTLVPEQVNRVAAAIALCVDAP
jgi:mRNA interferase MazF